MLFKAVKGRKGTESLRHRSISWLGSVMDQEIFSTMKLATLEMLSTMQTILSKTERKSSVSELDLGPYMPWMLRLWIPEES